MASLKCQHNLAEMVAAQKLNSEKIAIYGVVTDGEVWHFGKLIEQTFIKNENIFVITELGKIFAALHFIISQKLKQP